MKNQSIPFCVNPGVPMLIKVIDGDDTYDLVLKLAIEGVRNTGDKNPITGNTVFDIDIATKVETTLVK